MNHVPEKLLNLRQDHLLKYWQQLNPAQQESLRSQIDAFDPGTIRSMQQTLKNRHEQGPLNIQPFLEYAKAGNAGDRAAGKRLIADGKMGCLIVAGGQGTRLPSMAPRACSR